MWPDWLYVVLGTVAPLVNIVYLRQAIIERDGPRTGTALAFIGISTWWGVAQWLRVFGPLHDLSRYIAFTSLSRPSLFLSWMIPGGVYLMGVRRRAMTRQTVEHARKELGEIRSRVGGDDDAIGGGHS